MPRRPIDRPRLDALLRDIRQGTTMNEALEAHGISYTVAVKAARRHNLDWKSATTTGRATRLQADLEAGARHATDRTIRRYRSAGRIVAPTPEPEPEPAPAPKPEPPKAPAPSPIRTVCRVDGCDHPIAPPGDLYEMCVTHGREERNRRLTRQDAQDRARREAVLALQARPLTPTLTAPPPPLSWVAPNEPGPPPPPPFTRPSPSAATRRVCHCGGTAITATGEPLCLRHLSPAPAPRPAPVTATLAPSEPTPEPTMTAPQPLTTDPINELVAALNGGFVGSRTLLRLNSATLNLRTGKSLRDRLSLALARQGHRIQDVLTLRAAPTSDRCRILGCGSRPEARGLCHAHRVRVQGLEPADRDFFMGPSNRKGGAPKPDKAPPPKPTKATTKKQGPPPPEPLVVTDPTIQWYIDPAAPMETQPAQQQLADIAAALGVAPGADLVRTANDLRIKADLASRAAHHVLQDRGATLDRLDELLSQMQEGLLDGSETGIRRACLLLGHAIHLLGAPAKTVAEVAA